MKRTLGFAAIGIIVFFMLLSSFDSDDNPSATMFCAYGTLFVEFDNGRKTWGTIFLNEDGRPIQCNKKDRTYKGII
jgi:hypothetical protein